MNSTHPDALVFFRATGDLARQKIFSSLRAMVQRGPLEVRKGDGKLALQEFVNTRFVDFAAADRDKDGTLTIEEIIAYSSC